VIGNTLVIDEKSSILSRRLTVMDRHDSVHFYKDGFKATKDALTDQFEVGLLSFLVPLTALGTAHGSREKMSWEDASHQVERCRAGNEGGK